MQFRTIIPIEKSENQVDYSSNLLLMGSCFAENIGAKFDYFKFNHLVNPFGIIFNPISIEKLLDRIVNNRKFTETDIFYHNDLWHSYEVHSELSNPNKEVYLHKLNSLLEETRIRISEISHFQITYGTSWIYRNIESDKIVANCHKVPQKQFTKELLPIETIQNSIRNTIDLVREINPNCQFIFTVSPVRHVKDGFIENTVSKAHLISAIHHSQLETCNSKPATQNLHYFPSYEIMMDELRDYRFYSEDMLHPNKTAIDYIWERFLKSFINESAIQTLQEADAIQKSLLHKAFNPNSDSHQKFLTHLNQKILHLQSKYPYIKF